MLVEVRADVDRGGLDGAEEHLGDPSLFDVDQVGLEHAFGGFEALRAHFDYAAVGELGERCEWEGLDEGRGVRGRTV